MSAKIKEVKSRIATRADVGGHMIAGIGQNLIFGFWSSYMLKFYTDIFGLTAAFVGVLFLVARVWDAVDDPLMGMVVDRTRTKWGRFRPWLLFMALPVGIFMVLNFSAPDLPATSKMVYAAITYFLMSVAFSSVDIPYWSLPAAITTDPQERTKIYSLSKMGANVISALVGMVTIPLVQVLGKGNLKTGFFYVAIIYAIIGAVTYISGFFMIREHVEASTDKFDFKKSLSAISKNKPLVMVMIANFLINVGLLLRMNLNVYYAEYNLGNIGRVAILSLVSLPGIIIGSLLAPKLAKLLGKKKAIIGSNLFLLVLGIVFYFMGYSNFTAIIILSAIQMLVIGCEMVILMSMNADTIEYAEWKTGQRNEGVISSTQTFVAKLG
ncbi:MAG: glycoside-pentoside-hexuronide (GPH):cation symporter, partial [Oscillospiraceae bacterium]